MVPRHSVLQAPDQSYYVLKIKENRLVRQPVKIGLQSDFKLEIIEGLTLQDQIVATVEATMKEGELIKVKDEKKSSS